MDNPRLEAELLLAHTLGQDRVQLYADYDRPVNQEERQGFKELIQRRVGRAGSLYSWIPGIYVLEISG